MTAEQVLVWPIGFQSGLIVPPETMPGWLGAIADLNPVSATAATLDVNDGLGSAGARGSGKVTLISSGAGLARVDIRGETGNEPFTLRFAADGNAAAAAPPP